MEVHVGVETHGPPTKARRDAMRRAAARFSDDTSSIRVQHEPMSDRHYLIAQFTMRTTAQYKVVDDIAAGFKRDMWDFDDYMDCGLLFQNARPSHAAGVASQRQTLPVAHSILVHRLSVVP